MGFLRNAMKSGLALQAMRIARREMAKPENQRRAKQLLHKVTSRGGSTAQR
ncbi:hypothetical protein [Cellulomonas sp. Marseille-Q8402]